MQAWPWAAAPPQPEISSKVEAWDSGQGHGLEYLSGHVGVRAAEAMRVPEFVEPESEAELSEAPRPPSSGSGAAGGASAQEIPDSPPIVGPFFRQPSHPPYLLPPGAPGEALVNDVLGLTEALRIANALRSAAAGRAALAERLALTLSDARLLCSHLFRTMRGRMNARRALAALRASHDPRLARGVLQALVAALQHAGPAPFSAEEAETVIDHATALLLTGTVEMPRASEDLFALDWDLTSRLLGRVQQLANEHADSPGPLRPKAILLHASALDRFEKKEEAIGHYFEAWSELQKRHMTPSPMEAALIPALAELQYGTQQIRLGLHIAEKCYALRGESTEAVVSQVIVLHAQLTAPNHEPLITSAVTACRVVSDAAGSCALSSRAVDAARSLGPGHEFAYPPPSPREKCISKIEEEKRRLLLARILHVHATDLVVTGRLFAHERVRQEALRLLVSLDDPSLPDLDWMGHQEARRGRGWAPRP
eukprot:tig00020660_g12542.t1